MQYVLYKEYTDKYISYTETNKTVHVSVLEKAHKFNSIGEARNARKKATKKTAFFHVYAIMENGELEKVSSNTSKRKSFSKEERLTVYRKTEGHCYLCGDFVDFDSFEMEHRFPISKGGSNNLSNIFCSCHSCNVLKQDIYPDDLLEKVSKIFMHQMQGKYGSGWKWKMMQRELVRMMEK